LVNWANFPGTPRPFSHSIIPFQGFYKKVLIGGRNLGKNTCPHNFLLQEFLKKNFLLSGILGPLGRVFTF